MEIYTFLPKFDNAFKGMRGIRFSVRSGCAVSDRLLRCLCFKPREKQQKYSQFKIRL